GAREQDPRELDRETARLLLARRAEARRDQGRDLRGEDDADEHHDRYDQREGGEHGARGAARLFLVTIADEPRVDGDEGRREHPLPQHGLQHVGDAERVDPRVCRDGPTQRGREKAGANEPEYARDENARGDQQCAAASALLDWRLRLRRDLSRRGGGRHPGCGTGGRSLSAATPPSTNPRACARAASIILVTSSSP